MKFHDTKLFTPPLHCIIGNCSINVKKTNSKIEILLKLPYVKRLEQNDKLTKIYKNTKDGIMKGINY